MKFYLTILATVVLLTSCYKQSIADAMLNETDKQATTSTLNYEINGNKVAIAVKDAARQPIGSRGLYCEKSGGYVLSGAGSFGDFVFTFYTDSLEVGTYKYTGDFGPMYVTTFEGRPQYIEGPTDHMTFTVTSYRDGQISGNFSGQLTPLLIPGNSGNVYGATGSVVIKNGSFNNVPVFY